MQGRTYVKNYRRIGGGGRRGVVGGGVMTTEMLSGMKNKDLYK